MKYPHPYLLFILFLFPCLLSANCEKYFGEYQSSDSDGSLILDGNFFKLVAGTKTIQGTLNNFPNMAGNFMQGNLRHAYCTKNHLFIPYTVREKLIGRLTDPVTHWIQLGLNKKDGKRSISGNIFKSKYQFQKEKSVSGKIYPVDEIAFRQVFSVPEIHREEIQQLQSKQAPLENVVHSIGLINSFSKETAFFPCSAESSFPSLPTQSIHLEPGFDEIKPFAGFENFGDFGDLPSNAFMDRPEQMGPETVAVPNENILINAPQKKKRPRKPLVLTEEEIFRLNNPKELDRVIEKSRLEEQERENRKQASAFERAERARIRREENQEWKQAQRAIAEKNRIERATCSKAEKIAQKKKKIQSTVEANLKKFEEILRKEKLQEKEALNTHLKPRMDFEVGLPTDRDQEKRIKKDHQSNLENQ